MDTFVHLVPATPVCQAYKVLAVHQGAQALPVMIYKGRLCYVSGQVRTRVRVGWRFYNTVIVRFIDDSTTANVPAGKFNRGAKYAPFSEER